MMIQLNIVSRKCFRELENIHNRINLYKEEELMLFEFGEFLNLLTYCSDDLDEKT
jgi:hypothetical protein